MDCVFCLIVAGELPAQVVREDERTLAFMDVNPGARGHALVVPKAHTQDLMSAPAEDLAAVVLAAQEVARLATERLGADGVNLLNACGAAAWQTVFHLHVHVVPRWTGDALQLPWVPSPGDPESIAAAARALRGE